MYRLIIADDEPLIRAGLYYCNDWKQMGFEVAAMLEDGSDVLKFLEEERADVLLTDICMYQMSGLEAAARIREKYPWMKIVLLSGYREFEYAREAIRCQVYEYLLKPIDYEKLKSVFANIKKELDEAAQEEKLLRSFGEGEYEQVLALTRAVAGSVLGEGEEAWLSYARLKPMMQNAPPEIREVLVKRLLEEFRGRLVVKDAKLEEEFTRRLKSIQPDAEDFHKQLLGLFGWLNDKLVSGNLVRAKKPAADDCIAKACSYISNHLGEDFTYRDVAEFVHLSPRHFIRRFRAEMNETFTDYLVRIRIEGAMRLMDEGQTDAADVSAEVGYRDDKYFQQIFKKRVGCTPREYQRGRQGGRL
ncbi:MAG: response regulator [Lachnospiraceae bacterium]|nr:response regulator [Lachnospiraceae bacterium]